MLEARWDQSALLLHHKIHCGTVTIDKDKYLTPAYSLKATGAGHLIVFNIVDTYRHTVMP